ncbi:MAG: rhomboid family intramembrane serine protease [Opitutae bacterium]
MLSDRSFMRDSYHREGTSIHIWLISVLGAAFVLELVLLSPWWPTGGRLVASLFLTASGLQGGEIWRLLSHSLLHDSHNPFHIIFVLFSLAFLGNELVPLLGPRRFLAVFVATILGGGLAWTATHWIYGGNYYGAGAGVVGLFCVLASVYPDREMRLLLLPISFRAQHLLWGLIAVDLFGLALYEILGSPVPIDFSPSAHLGGILAGWIYVRFFHANNGWDRAPGLILPGWLHFRKPARPAGAADQTTGPGGSTRNLRAEVDLILDKITSRGFGALTEEEKRVLDEAKDMLNRH